MVSRTMISDCLLDNPYILEQSREIKITRICKKDLKKGRSQRTNQQGNGVSILGFAVLLCFFRVYTFQQPKGCFGLSHA